MKLLLYELSAGLKSAPQSGRAVAVGNDNGSHYSKPVVPSRA